MTFATMQIVWTVLEMAKDNEDAAVISACRRLINANRIGWRKHHDPRDLKLVMSFYDPEPIGIRP